MLLLPLIFTVVLVLADQAIKYMAVVYLKPVGNIDIIKSFLSLTYVENRGAAFGVLQNGKWFFVLLTIVVLGVCVYYYIRLGSEKRYSIIIRPALVLVCAGALGNMLDRLFRGFVVDMLNFCILGYDYPVFNFADICVCTGAFLLVIGVFVSERHREAS